MLAETKCWVVFNRDISFPTGTCCRSMGLDWPEPEGSEALLTRSDYWWFTAMGSVKHGHYTVEGLYRLRMKRPILVRKYFLEWMDSWFKSLIQTPHHGLCRALQDAASVHPLASPLPLTLHSPRSCSSSLAATHHTWSAVVTLIATFFKILTCPTPSHYSGIR